MRIDLVRSGLAAATFALAAVTARAQSVRPFSVEVSAVTANIALSQSDGFGATFRELGGEAQLRYASTENWSFGLGFQWTTDTNQGQTLTMSAIFVEPRVTINIGYPQITPYLDARLAFSRGADAYEGESISLDGRTLSGGAGVLIPISDRIRLDLSAGLAKNWIGNGDFSSLGYVARAGLSGRLSSERSH